MSSSHDIVGVDQRSSAVLSSITLDLDNVRELTLGSLGSTNDPLWDRFVVPGQGWNLINLENVYLSIKNYTEICFKGIFFGIFLPVTAPMAKRTKMAVFIFDLTLKLVG